MIYKSLFLLVFANLFNQAYQLENISCPKWVPVRCYCEVVKAKEQECATMRIPWNICKARTAAWVEDNLMLRENFRRAQAPAPLPQRDRMINIEP